MIQKQQQQGCRTSLGKQDVGIHKQWLFLHQQKWGPALPQAPATQNQPIPACLLIRHGESPPHLYLPPTLYTRECLPFFLCKFVGMYLSVFKNIQFYHGWLSHLFCPPVLCLPLQQMDIHHHWIPILAPRQVRERKEEQKKVKDEDSVIESGTCHF